MPSSPIAPFAHQTLHERLADHIAGLILSGDMPAGQPIPSERELAERFQVSRSAVRDAVRMLAARGLVDVRHGVGTIVTEDGQAPYQESLELLLRRGRYSRLELLDLRRHIEVQVAARLASRPEADMLAHLWARLRALQSAVEAGDRALAEARHLEFHLALAQGTANRALIDVVQPPIRVTFDLTMTPQLRTSAPAWDEYADHADLLEAIAAGRVEGARQLMAAHLDAAWSGVADTPADP